MGIVVSFVLALINLARRASHPAIDILTRRSESDASLISTADPGALSGPKTVVVRMAAPLFFANGATYEDRVKEAVTKPGPQAVRHVVLDMEAVTDVDVTGSESFAELKRWLSDANVTLSFARVRPEAKDRLHRFGVIGSETVYGTDREAVDALTRSAETGAADSPTTNSGTGATENASDT